MPHNDTHITRDHNAGQVTAKREHHRMTAGVRIDGDGNLVVTETVRVVVMTSVETTQTKPGTKARG